MATLASAANENLTPASSIAEAPPTFIAYDDLLDVKDNNCFLEKLMQEALSHQSKQKSFWRGSSEMSHPTCTLEALACDLFKFHTNGKDYVLIDGNDIDKYEGEILNKEVNKDTSGATEVPPITSGKINNKKKSKKKKKKKKKSGNNFINVKKLKIDHKKSGVEWWVQVRGPEESKGTSLGFHWDENYEDESGNSSVVTRRNKLPWLSTVSYLCDKGAPTVAVPISPFQVEEQLPKNEEQDNDSKLQVAEGYVSFPKIGKHIAFKGHYLHGVPSELVDDSGDPLDAFHRKKHIGVGAMQKETSKYIRITFLVNIWINTGPPNSVLANTIITPLINKYSKNMKIDDSGTTFQNNSCDKNYSLHKGLKLLKDCHTVQRDPISEVITNQNTPVCGFGFGKFEDDSYQFWLPCPLEAFCKGKAKKKQSRSSFKIKFNGGEDAPCFICRP